MNTFPAGDVVLRREAGGLSSPTIGVDFCHVRGHVLRAIDHFILTVHGAAIRDRILARLPSVYADDFRHGSLTGVVLYQLAVFEAYASAANSIVLGHDLSTWREIGRGSAEGEIASLLRSVPRGADPQTLFRRCLAIWSRLADFGVWTADHRDPAEASLRISELGPAPATLRNWLLGVVEQSLRHVGLAGTTVVAKGAEAAGAPELELTIRLR